MPHAIRDDLSAVKVRRFGWTMLAAFTVLAYLVGWRANTAIGYGFALVLMAVGVVIAVTCAASHRAGSRLFVLWMTVGGALGKVTNTLLLSLLFFLFLPWFTWIRFGDPLRLRLKTSGTYWEDPAPHEPTLERAARSF